MNALSGLRVVVIGAGFGGLSAAAHLRGRGAEVTVLERAHAVGGKAAFDVRDGFVFDTGPTLLTMPEVVRDAFAAVNASPAMPTVLPVDPQCRYLFADGEELVVFKDRKATAAGIARFSPRDARAWGRFLDASETIWNLAGEPYLEAPFDGFASFSGRGLRRGPRAVQLGMTLGTLDELARDHFESENMRRLVRRFATYAGASPWEASAAFAMIAHLEVTLGAFYPSGGMHALATALAKAIERAGGVIRTGAEVTSIEVVGSAASGVVLASGERVEADMVVCNTDPLFAMRALLSPEVARAEGEAEISARPRSLSGLVFSFGVEGELESDAHHTVLFADDYAEEFRAIFDRGSIALDPTIYVSVPSHVDGSRAPAGHHAVFAMVNAPGNEAGSDRADSEKERRDVEVIARVRDHVVHRLSRRFARDFGARIRLESVRSPRDIARTGAPGGAIYGAAPHGKLAPFERPRNRATSVSGLYFVGGATHPGGGVPMVTLGGRFVAEMIAADHDARARERAAAGRGLFARLAGAFTEGRGGT